jgi:rhodanese-related sulfurtransferase
MRSLPQGPLREAAVILAAGTVLGFAYTAVTGKGLFGMHPPNASSVPASQKSAPAFISLQEALELFRSGNAVFVDSRHSYDYSLGHIKGALNLPLKEFNNRILDILPRDKLLVTYCDGEDCNSSVDLAMKLDSAGFTNLRIFFGGWKEWEANQQPVEK